jgi:acyl-coenzyme A thioesterase PaaI-like protein
MEIERVGPGRVRGRGFIKQDHQGAERGSAHEGVLAAALSEAMGLACGLQARATQVEVQLHSLAPIGSFVEVEAEAHGQADGRLGATATARVEEQVVARSRGTYTRKQLP